MGRYISGDVWLASRWSASSNAVQTVAVKAEWIETTDSLLDVEAGVYKAIHGITGVPKLHFRSQEYGYRFLGMSMLGHSFEDQLNMEHRSMHLKTVINFGTQMVSLD